MLALLIVTLLSVVVLEFTESVQIGSRFVRNARNGLQAETLARSGVTLGEAALIADAFRKRADPESHPQVESLSDPWAVPFGPFEIADGFGTVAYAIEDESGKFNVNALAMTSNPLLLEMRKQLFQGILAGLGLDPNLMFPLIDWLDPDDETSRETGAEEKYYLERSPPHSARNGLLLSLDELALVRGWGALTPAEWQRLRSVATVLPDESLRINVNTAPPLLLAALFTAAGDAALADAVTAIRDERPFTSVSDLHQLPGMDQIPPLLRAVFQVRSRTFRIHAVGRAAGVHRALSVTVTRDSKTLSVIHQRWESSPIASLTSANPSDRISGFSRGERR